MPSPAIEAEIDGIGESNGLGRPSAIFPHHVQERRAPLLVGEEGVEVAADRAIPAAAQLRARVDEQRLAPARAAGLSMVDLVAGQRPPGQGPRAHTMLLPGPLLRPEYGVE